MSGLVDADYVRAIVVALNPPIDRIDPDTWSLGEPKKAFVTRVVLFGLAV
jgi:hypothetical protein